jgi:hypothetical protein
MAKSRHKIGNEKETIGMTRPHKTKTKNPHENHFGRMLISMTDAKKKKNENAPPPTILESHDTGQRARDMRRV